MASPFLPGMKEGLRELVEEWGVNTDIQRFISTTNPEGKLSGSFQSQGIELLWIQPIGGFSDVKEKGLDEETTHLSFQFFSGTTVQAKDRLTPSGASFDYDVIKSNLKEEHRVSELKLVRRT